MAKKKHVSIAGIILSLFVLAFALLSTDCLRVATRDGSILTSEQENLYKATPFIFGAVGLTLFIRSFLPGRSFGRAVLTFIASYFMFGGTVQFVLMLIYRDPLPSIAGIIGTALPGILGGIGTMYGFEPKKRFANNK